MFALPQWTNRTSIETSRCRRRPESRRRRVARPGLFDRLEPRTLLSATDPGWALRAGGPQNDGGRAVAVDSSGDLYMTGFFSGTADFGGTSLTSASSTAGYVAKYSPSGSLLWATRFGGSPTGSSTFPPNAGSGITVAPDGPIYLAGTFSGTSTFGGPTLTLSSSGQQDIFAARLDPATGQFLWVDRMGGTGMDISHNIVTDSSGMYITGSFYGTADFGSTLLTTPGVPTSL